MKTVSLDEVIEIIDLAREGEIDMDLRSIRHRINSLVDHTDLLRQQHDAEMVEWAEWVGKKDGLYVDKSKWAIPDDENQDDIYLTTSELLAQFRSK